MHWTSKRAGRRYFTIQIFVNVMYFHINELFFPIGNMVLKKDIGTEMGTDPATYWAKLLFYFFESKYIKQLISNGSSKAYKYNRFLD